MNRIVRFCVFALNQTEKWTEIDEWCLYECTSARAHAFNVEYKICGVFVLFGSSARWRASFVRRLAFFVQWTRNEIFCLTELT